MDRTPYLDLLLEGRKTGVPAAEVFDRFVHWGYWEEPRSADKSVDDLKRAMERLDDALLDTALLQDGQSVLDAGCGLGGTLGAIDERFSRMTLTGVNIDPRQLEVAAAQVKPRDSNHLEFFEADACELEFPDQSFDRILAVECIFHFPSRAGFLKQAARLLRQDGRLVLSDFVPRWISSSTATASSSSSRLVVPRRTEGPNWLGRWIERQISSGFGESRRWDEGTYASMAEEAGLKVLVDKDITRHTLPTYPALLRLFRHLRGAHVHCYAPSVCSAGPLS